MLCQPIPSGIFMPLFNFHFFNKGVHHKLSIHAGLRALNDFNNCIHSNRTHNYFRKSPYMLPNKNMNSYPVYNLHCKNPYMNHNKNRYIHPHNCQDIHMSNNQWDFPQP